MKENLKLWIARNEGYYDDEDENLRITGELLICYDQPILEYDSDKRRKMWKYSRIMHEAPSYMFPEIEEMTCRVFTTHTIEEIIEIIKT